MILESIRFVLERLSDLIKYEASILLVDEKKEVQSLQRELELIESYLKDIDEIEQQATVNHVLQTKVQHLMQILPDIENSLDAINHQKQGSCCFDNLKVFFSCVVSNPLIRKHHFVEEITRIRENLRDILQRPEEYRLPNSFPQVVYKRRLATTSSIIKDEIIIGLEEDVNNLVAKFVGKHGANSAILGMGGSGKTTLAKMFYNHKEIKEAFPRRAWVCLSQEWNTNDVLAQICAMLGIKLSEDERSIANVKLQEFLAESSCLIVLDDVWKRTALQALLQTLLSGNGKVLITTRNESVVHFPNIRAFYIHIARHLTPKESWELFSRIVCNSCGGIINLVENDDFVKLGREMLEKCDGLPLAIITLAGLLGTKGTIQQWESIKDDVVSRIMRDGNGSLDNEAVKKVLELSYFDLPYHLKLCFLYLGTFKEDANIEVDMLINLWIDEGFVKPDHQCPESRRLKEVAKDFLDEFVQRCMVQVVSKDYAGDVREIRIHDLMRDLCIYKAKELGFFQVLSPSKASSTQVKPPYRRAIIQNRRSFVPDNPRLRTLICINVDVRHRLPKELFPLEMLKQVRVLYLHGVELEDSVEEIGNMVLLSMEQLRVLSLLGFIQGQASYLGVDKLRNLQTLDVSAGEWILNELHGISTDLRELKMYAISSQQQLDAVYVCVNHTSTCLESLELHVPTVSGLEFGLQNMKLEECRQLRYLRLHGKIEKQKEPWLFPPKLLCLYLGGTKVEEEENIKEVFAQLVHLRELTLGGNSYNGDKLIMSGLPQLQKLCLFSLSSLKECIIEQGSLPKLQQLRIAETTWSYFHVQEILQKA